MKVSVFTVVNEQLIALDYFNAHCYCSRNVFASLTVIIYLFWVVIGDLRFPFFNSILLLSFSLRIFPVRNSSKRQQLCVSTGRVGAGGLWLVITDGIRK
jgi:hypothetical protein